MKRIKEWELIVSNGDHAHACITRGSEAMGTVTARVSLGYVLLYESHPRLQELHEDAEHQGRMRVPDSRGG